MKFSVKIITNASIMYYTFDRIRKELSMNINEAKYNPGFRLEGTVEVDSEQEAVKLLSPVLKKWLPDADIKMYLLHIDLEAYSCYHICVTTSGG